LQEDQIDHWKTLRDEMFSNDEFIKHRRAREAKRLVAVEEMKDCLAKYMNHELNNAEFRAIFQKKTATDWDSFGLKGFSGAMFLNMLVNNIPNQDEFAQQLMLVLPEPSSDEAAYQRLNDFMNYLKGLMRSGGIAKRKIQPAHTPFFFSAWWHIQNPKLWPIYYISGRSALVNAGVYTPQNDHPIDDYFVFRESFLLLMDKLGLEPWEMEHLCVWHEERSVHIASPVEPIEAVNLSRSSMQLQPQVESDILDQEKNSHAHIQWLLARVGKAFGYKIWIAANDHKRIWNKEMLGQYSIGELPYFNGVGPKSKRMIELIDVVWLKGSNKIVAAFEVESTTSIFSGLLRMSDLAIALDNFIFPLYIAVPSVRVEDVKAQLSRLTFQRLELHEHCRFFTFEDFIREADAMSRYASDVSAIDKIAQQVGEINEEGY
jgi:type II restriction enzyme